MVEVVLVVVGLVALTAVAIVRMMSNPDERADAGSPVLSALDEVFNPAQHRAMKELEKEHVLPVQQKQGGLDPQSMTIELRLGDFAQPADRVENDESR